jgi:hypothetical protein
MAAPRKLKVYRTAAGFNDLYVAAPSKKAALAAWGSDHDLFARGIAELVHDPALGAEPLASPGVVIKRSRGTAAEQLAVATPTRPASTRSAPPEPEVRTKASAARKTAAPAPPKPKPPKPKPPKPKRDTIDTAETALETITSDYDRKLRAIAEREAVLARERHALERQRDRETQEAQDTVDRERRAYDAALREWQG